MVTARLRELLARMEAVPGGMDQVGAAVVGLLGTFAETALAWATTSRRTLTDLVVLRRTLGDGGFPLRETAGEDGQRRQSEQRRRRREEQRPQHPPLCG